MRQQNTAISERQTRLFKVLDSYLIDTGALLGSGQYGNVYKGYAVNNYGKIFAVKETPLKAKHTRQDILLRKKQAAIREINSLKELQHPHIIRFITAKQTSKHMYLIMEYCEGGSLESYVEKYQPDEKQSLYLFSQIIAAFQYLIKVIKHKHGDVKPANILLHNGQAKLADFGFSKQFVEENDQCFSYTGSPLYTSPQILEGQAYTTKSEIWSLGITLYYMLCYDPIKRQQSFPWWGATDVQLAKEIKSKPYISFTVQQQDRLSVEVRNLLSRMLEVQEEKRITWDELFASPLFSFEMVAEVIYDKYQDDEEDEDEDNSNNIKQNKKDDDMLDVAEGDDDNTNNINYNNNNNVITDMHELLNTNKYEIEQMQEIIRKQNKKQLTQEKRQQISILSDPDFQISQQFIGSHNDNNNNNTNSRTSASTTTTPFNLQLNLNSLQQYQPPTPASSYHKRNNSNNEIFIHSSRPPSSQVLTVRDQPFYQDPSKLNSPSGQLSSKQIQNFQPFSNGFQTSITGSKKVTTLDVTYSQAYRGNACLQNIQEGELNSRLQTELEEYISQERQLSYFVFHTAKSVQDVFKRFNLIKPTLGIDVRLLFVLCKRSKVISEELLQDITLKRSVQLRTAKQIPSNSSVSGGVTSNAAQISQVQQIVNISKDHWKYFGKNNAMKSSYQDKLQSEIAIYNMNYLQIKEKLAKLQDINPDSSYGKDSQEVAAADDKLMLTSDDGRNINLHYENEVISCALGQLLSPLQRIVYKISLPGTELNEEDLRLIYLIEDLFMVYTFEQTFRAQRQEQLNIQRFYFMRSRTHHQVVLTRISQAYKSIFNS